ncbi:MAG: Rrf2 family transcriptional regulator [Ruminococcus sp.]|nr:Rrf2 family transcriptional regulator [Ruminococcus sp.]
MHITLEADYAVRIMQVLCKAFDTRIDAKEISKRACVTQSFTLKILRKLSAAGLVRSFKGTKGGYIASRKPEEITLLEVIEAIEGTYHFSRCLEQDHKCTMGSSGSCSCQNVFKNITASVRKQLAENTFKELIGQC